MTMDPLLEPEALLCFAIYSAGHAFNRAYRPLLQELELTYPQYLIMLLLWRQDGMAVKDLGERLFLDSGTLTPLLKRLESAGLVKRERDARDQRVVLISLTPAGHELRARAAKVPQAMAEAIGRSDEDRASLQREIIRLRDMLNAAVLE
ncbi:MarR family transcriptional regulator [Cystobacter fuscus]|nr:MarR family transcriptional regulator [Cystobacter fuscus]